MKDCTFYDLNGKEDMNEDDMEKYTSIDEQFNMDDGCLEAKKQNQSDISMNSEEKNIETEIENFLSRDSQLKTRLMKNFFYREMIKWIDEINK